MFDVAHRRGDELLVDEMDQLSMDRERQIDSRANKGCRRELNQTSSDNERHLSRTSTTVDTSGQSRWNSILTKKRSVFGQVPRDSFDVDQHSLSYRTYPSHKRRCNPRLSTRTCPQQDEARSNRFKLALHSH